MASASVSTAVKANPGAFRNCRKASRISAFMLPLVTHHCVSCSGSRGLYRLYARAEAAVPFAGFFGDGSPKRARLEKLRPCPPQRAVGFTIAAATAPWRWTDAFL